MLISVIIPVYNAEKTLKKCVDSVLNQSYKDFELILIDDGSNDSSPAICDAIAKEDPRVVAVHKENGGVSSARNVGIETAKGEYLTFIDNDDELPLNALELYADALQDRNYAVVQGGVVFLNPNGTMDQKQNGADNEAIVLSPLEYIQISYVNKIYVWGKLFQTKMAKKHRFPEGHYGEDVYFNGMILSEPAVESVCILPENTYIHFSNPESASSTWTVQHLTDVCETIYFCYCEINKTNAGADIKSAYLKLAVMQFLGKRYEILIKRGYYPEIKERIKAIEKSLLADLPKSKLSVKDKLVFTVLVSSNWLYRKYILHTDPTMKEYEKYITESFKNQTPCSP